jgi:ppGpp synthetase/RelA/SpoT-type nucleotidyltranferase
MPKLARLAKDFNPSEPRDEGGKWTSGGSTGTAGAVMPTPATPAAESAEHAKLRRSCEVAHEKAKEPLSRTLKKLKDLFPGAEVKGRVKTVTSMTNKCAKEGKGPAELYDIIGTRIQLDSIDDFPAAVAKIKANFHFVREKNLLEKPLGDYYRGYHLNVEMDGRVGEIQLRTANQTKLADWAHNTIYKDLHPNAEAIQAHLSELTDYAKQMSDYYYALDTKKPGHVAPPPCTPIVQTTVGCL